MIAVLRDVRRLGRSWQQVGLTPRLSQSVASDALPSAQAPKVTNPSLLRWVVLPRVTWVTACVVQSDAASSKRNALRMRCAHADSGVLFSCFCTYLFCGVLVQPVWQACGNNTKLLQNLDHVAPEPGRMRERGEKPPRRPKNAAFKMTAAKWRLRGNSGALTSC